MCPAIRSGIYRILQRMRSKTDLARITHRLALAGTLPVVFLPLSPVLHGNTLRIKKPHIRTKLASRRYRIPGKSKNLLFLFHCKEILPILIPSIFTVPGLGFPLTYTIPFLRGTVFHAIPILAVKYSPRRHNIQECAPAGFLRPKSYYRTSGHLASQF